MRRLVLLVVLTVGCRSKAPPPAADAAPTSFVVSASRDAGPAPDPTPSVETAPVFGVSSGVQGSPTVRDDAVVALAGTLLASSAADDCPDLELLALDAPLHAIGKDGKPAVDGRGVGKHAVIGNTNRVCLWDWKKPAPYLPAGSHLVVTGRLSTPAAASNPSGMMLFDVAVLSATPPKTPAPPAALPEGDTVVYVRTGNTASRHADVDVAYLYWGDAARAAAIGRHAALPADKSWFIVDDSPQLRSVTLPPTVRAEYDDDGWRGMSLEDAAKPPNAPFVVRVEKGAITQLRKITLP